jgi:hypothetical protein
VKSGNRVYSTEIFLDRTLLPLRREGATPLYTAVPALIRATLLSAALLQQPPILSPDSRILAAKTGHGDFADYHERFNHEDAYLLCSCGERKSRLHFFVCCKAKRRSLLPPGSPSLALPYLLGTPKGAIELADWLSKTSFFKDICPRQPHTPLPSDQLD